MGRVTIQTIAEEARVSVGTVDRALNNRGRISKDTRKRVLEIAERLGYQPNKIASALGRQREFRIAAITPCNPFFFYEHIRDGLEDAIKETNDYGVTIEQILCNSLGVEDQKKVLEKLDYTRYDGIVFNAGGDALTPYINRIVDGGVPVVTFNSDAKNSKRLFFVGENPFRSGQLCGEMMGRLLGGKGSVAIMTSFFHPGAAMDRRDGFKDALRAYPGIQIVGDFEYSDDEEKAYRTACSIMRQYPQINGIFSNSATGSYASGKYIYEFCKPDARPVLIGYDVTEPVEQYLKNGYFDMVIDQQPRRQSYYAIMLMYRYLTEHWQPEAKEYVIRVNMVMRYNAEEHSMKRMLKSNILV